MYYVHKNTTEKNQVIGEFNTKDEAIAYMEYRVTWLQDDNVTGYAVRDYALKTIAEWEI
jgi:hypothetical protein